MFNVRTRKYKTYNFPLLILHTRQGLFGRLICTKLFSSSRTRPSVGRCRRTYTLYNTPTLLYKEEILRIALVPNANIFDECANKNI